MGKQQNCWYRRIGRIVEVQLGHTVDSLDITSGGATVYTLPRGFRPPLEITTAAEGRANNLGQVAINEKGEIRLNLFEGTSKYFAGHIIYFTDDPMPD